MPSNDAIATVIKTYFAATRDMDVETWLDTFAEDALSYDPAGGTPLKGHAEMRQYFGNITELFERVGLAEEFVHIVGNQAAVKWTGRGVGKNGRDVVFEGINLFQFNRTGKIQTLYAYWNPMAAMAELKSE